MARYSDNAPIGHTCPMIDSVISFINSVEWSEEEKDLEDESEKALLTLEEIREANSTLRDWGNDECKRANEFENDLDYANRQIKDLESEIASLKKDVAYYENLELEKTA